MEAGTRLMWRQGREKISADSRQAQAVTLGNEKRRKKRAAVVQSGGNKKVRRGQRERCRSLRNLRLIHIVGDRDWVHEAGQGK